MVSGQCVSNKKLQGYQSFANFRTQNWHSLQLILRIFMSITQSCRIRSPATASNEFFPLSYVKTSPRKGITHYPQFSISIKQTLPSQRKSPLIVDTIKQNKTNCISYARLPLAPSKSSKSFRGDLRVKLGEYKQKINRIQGMVFGEMTAAKESQQPIKKFSENHLNIVKDPYFLEKGSQSCHSEGKSQLSCASTQAVTTRNEQKQEESYKRLSFNGHVEIFRILRFINEGCFGKVYLVKHVATNFICCLKVITKEGLTPQIKEQISREVLIQSYLSHPNIVAIYGCSYDKDNVYLLLEACMGGNLFDRVIMRQVGEKEAASTIREACRALEYMHENDIIHRDIKPENILLHEGTAKICDFGWAIHSPLLRNTRCGTPLYLSPEVILSDLYDSKVDVWSIGVLTYELLFGKIPFDIKCINDLSKIVTEDISFQGRVVSSDARDFILRCLSKNARERMTMTQALDHGFMCKDNSKYRQTIN